jgi:putative oxidoreductase
MSPPSHHDHEEGNGHEQQHSRGRDHRRPRSAHRISRGRGANITLWVLQVVLALVFVGAGMSKLGGAPEMIVMFDDIGAGQWFRYATGTLELVGAVGLMIPRACGLAAVGLSVLMACATVITLVFLYDPVWMPLAVLVMCVVVAWGRWPETKALVLTRRPG